MTDLNTDEYDWQRRLSHINMTGGALRKYDWRRQLRRGASRKMRMWKQYYTLKKKHIHFIEIFIVGITLRAIYVRYETSRNKVVKYSKIYKPINT